MKINRMIGTIVCLGLLASAQAAMADVFMKRNHHTDGMNIMGRAQPPRDSIQTTWMAKDKLRMDSDDTSTLMRLDRDMIYIIDHAQKSYMEMPMDAKERQAIAEAMEKDMTVKVTATGETRRIGQWNCTKYLQEIQMGPMPVKTTVWATEDIQLPKDIMDTFASMQSASQTGSRRLMEKIKKEMEKIKGVPVLTETTTQMMKNTTVKSSTELLEVKEGTAPAGTYELPQGYTRVEQLQGHPGQAMPQGATPKMPKKPRQ